MAEIQITYLERCCDMGVPENVPYGFFGQCYSDAASDLDCPFYKCQESYTDKKGVIHVSYSSCVYANYKKKYKGMSIKNYELEEKDSVRMRKRENNE